MFGNWTTGHGVRRFDLGGWGGGGQPNRPLTSPEHIPYRMPTLRWFGKAMVTSKNPSPSEYDRGEPGGGASGAAAHPFGDTQPLDATQPLDTTAPFPPADGHAHGMAEGPSFVRRHPLAVGIIAAALAVVVVSGLTAWGVGTAVAASYDTAASAPVTTAVSVPPAVGARKGATAAHSVVRGTITGIAGSAWTITTRAGATQRVKVSAATAYGSKKVPARASDFAVGTAVVVVEKSDGDAKTAVRVTAAKSGGAAATAPSTPNA